MQTFALSEMKKRLFTSKFVVAVIVFLVVLLINKYWVQLMLIQGNSMTPTFHHMQLVLVCKHPKTYSAGDVIAFQCEGLDCVLVKRIAKVTDDDRYYVLGDNLEESVDSRDSRVGLVERESIIGVVPEW